MKQQVIIVVSEVEQEVIIGNNNLLFHLSDYNSNLLFHLSDFLESFRFKNTTITKTSNNFMYVSTK